MSKADLASVVESVPEASQSSNQAVRMRTWVIEEQARRRSLLRLLQMVEWALNALLEAGEIRKNRD